MPDTDHRTVHEQSDICGNSQIKSPERPLWTRQRRQQPARAEWCARECRVHSLARVRDSLVVSVAAGTATSAVEGALQGCEAKLGSHHAMYVAYIGPCPA